MSRRDRLVLSASALAAGQTATGAGGDASSEGLRRPPFSPGEEVSYVSRDGISVCKALVRGVNVRGADLDVYSPGCSTPVALTGVQHHEGPARLCPPGACFSPMKGEPA